MKYPFDHEYLITCDFNCHLASHALHPGDDFGTPVGTPVYAIESGQGRQILDHTNPNSVGLFYHITVVGTSRAWEFGHLSEFKAGQENVAEGQLIGLTGNTGKSSGPHCHISLFINGINVDPLPVIESIKNTVAGQLNYTLFKNNNNLYLHFLSGGFHGQYIITLKSNNLIVATGNIFTDLKGTGDRLIDLNLLHSDIYVVDLGGIVRTFDNRTIITPTPILPIIQNPVETQTTVPVPVINPVPVVAPVEPVVAPVSQPVVVPTPIPAILPQPIVVPTTPEMPSLAETYGTQIDGLVKEIKVVKAQSTLKEKLLVTLKYILSSGLITFAFIPLVKSLFPNVDVTNLAIVLYAVSNMILVAVYHETPVSMPNAI